MRRSHRFLVTKLEKGLKEDGAALVIVLALLVLLTGVVVAYLSRSNTELKVSTASMASTRADILSRSATEAIIAEIQQDIKEGSDRDGNIYVPKSGLDMVLKSRLAADDGAAAAGVETALPNLVRISRRATSQTAANKMISPGSNVASTAESVNKRSISAKRWNKHYLLPPANYPSDETPAIDPTPPTTFPVPYWVMVTSDGPTWINALDNAMAKKVIGRYAFAVYNEGGLLDANVAGYPSVSAGTAAGKSSLAYADLTQLSLRRNTTLTQMLVDNLVGWRNKGLTGAVGDFGGNYSFASAQNGREAFHDEFILREDSGYTKVKFPGDQRFLSRQALIKYWERAGLKMEALQYLTTFSRSLERPSLLANSATIPGWVQASNPSVVALSSGSGAPLVGKRFSLRRLAWLTPNGPSNGATGGVYLQALRDAGFTDDEINEGTGANITRYFGLTWTGGEWTYGGDHIRTLAEVQSANEEPNFFELLKAAIPEGALQMGATASTGNGAYNIYQRGRDQDLNRAIFQIGANIIDQFDADSYPTRITYTSAGVPVSVAGVESLPYIYGTRQGLVMTREPDSTVPTDLQAAAPAPTGGNVTNEGEVASMLFPILWNPHYEDPNAPMPVGGMIPDIRFTAASDHPLVSGNSATGNLSANAHSTTGSKAGTPGALKADDTALNVSSARNLFINPTLIRDGSAGNATPAPTNSSFGNSNGLSPLRSSVLSSVTGVILGKSPLQWEVSGQVHTANRVEYVLPPPSIATDSAITLRMEYLTPAGWLPYDEKFTRFFSTVNITNWVNWDSQVQSDENWSLAIDPRPSLFGMYTSHGGVSTPPSTNLATDGVDLGDSAFIGLHGWHGASLKPFQLAINSGVGGIADRDGIVRPGMAGRGSGATENPLALATGNASSAMTAQDRARPIVLNRPFKSIGELGYVFSGMPWRNLDQSSHLSGFSRLLDLFSLNDVDDSALVSGKVDLNTRQAPVLQAIIAGAVKDEIGATTLDAVISKALAEGLVAWTKNTTTGAAATAGPLIERSDLVSRYNSTRTTRNWGFTSKIATEMGADSHFARLQEASVRALANNGQTRVWNLMIDIVAQSGRYGISQTDLAKFIVEGERRIWVHVAIDRFTGKVIDKQVEIVTE